jgi:acyl carrier protein
MRFAKCKLGAKMEQDIKQQIIDFITSNFLFDDNQASIGEKESLLETGVIDSTGVLELIAFIEETYGIKVEDEEIIPENLDTILDITFFINQKLSTAQEAHSS